MTMDGNLDTEVNVDDENRLFILADDTGDAEHTGAANDSAKVGDDGPAGSSEMIVDPKPDEGAVSGFCDGTEDLRKRKMRIKRPPLSEEEIQARRCKIFQDWRSANWENAIVYLNQLTKFTVTSIDFASDTAKLFRVNVQLENQDVFEGVGVTKKLAKQLAATKAMRSLIVMLSQEFADTFAQALSQYIEHLSPYSSVGSKLEYQQTLPQVSNKNNNLNSVLPTLAVTGMDIDQSGVCTLPSDDVEQRRMFGRLKRSKEDSMNARRATVFEKWSRSNGENAIAYLNEVAKIQSTTVTEESSGSFRAQICCDGQVFEHVGESKKMAKHLAANDALVSLFRDFTAVKLDYPADSQASMTDDPISGVGYLSFESSSSSVQSEPRSKRARRKDILESTGGIVDAAAHQPGTRSALGNAGDGIEIGPKVEARLQEMSPAWILQKIFPMTKYTPLAPLAVELVTGSVAEKRSSVMSVEVNGEVFTGAGPSVKKARAAAAAGALEKLFCLHFDLMPDGMTEFRGSTDEWMHLVPKPKERKFARKPKSSVLKPPAAIASSATGLTTAFTESKPVVPVAVKSKLPPLAPGQEHPVAILCNIYPTANFITEKVASTIGVEAQFCTQINIEGCCVEGLGSTKQDSKRVAADKALSVIQAIGVVAERLKERRAKKLGLLRPQHATPNMFGAGQFVSMPRAVSVSAQDYAYGYRVAAKPKSIFPKASFSGFGKTSGFGRMNMFSKPSIFGRGGHGIGKHNLRKNRVGNGGSNINGTLMQLAHHDVIVEEDTERDYPTYDNSGTNYPGYTIGDHSGMQLGGSLRYSGGAMQMENPEFPLGNQGAGLSYVRARYSTGVKEENYIPSSVGGQFVYGSPAMGRMGGMM